MREASQPLEAARAPLLCAGKIPHLPADSSRRSAFPLLTLLLLGADDTF